MRSKLLIYLIIFATAFFLAYWLFHSVNNNEGITQNDVIIIRNNIKNVRKLVVKEITYSEYFNFENTKVYAFNLWTSKKNIRVFVSADVRVSYDMAKIDFEIDSVNKVLKINKIPESEIVIAPTVKYIDMEQSFLNKLKKNDFNKLNDSSISKLKQNINIETIKAECDERLIIELNSIFFLAKQLGWKIEKSNEIKLPIILNDQI